MSDTLLRQWAMLRMIPRAPRKSTATDLHKQLAARGFKTSKRTVERDLVNLSRAFGLYCDDRSQPHGWQFMKDAELMDLPSMDLQTALTLKLVSEFTAHLLPRSTVQYLKPHLRRAGEVLKESAHEGLARWNQVVRVLPRWQRLERPEVNSTVLDAVYQALLERKCLQIRYASRQPGEDKAREHEIHPLGLVFRDQITYLVCTYYTYQDIRQLALHRIKAADVLDQKRRVPSGFDLDEYIAGGAFDLPVGQAIKLKVRFASHAAAHLRETPLSKDQQLTTTDDEHVELRATVLDTSQLRWWLLGFGAQVEVIAPTYLRREFAEQAKRLAERYG